jgi:hypothetical protein
MSRPKHRTRADLNQTQIVKELRDLGFDVDIIASLPGLYDLVVCGRKTMHNEDFLYLNVPACVRVEVKSENGLLTDNELDYYDSLQNPFSYIVAYCTKDVLDWFGL